MNEALARRLRLRKIAAAKKKQRDAEAAVDADANDLALDMANRLAPWEDDDGEETTTYTVYSKQPWTKKHEKEVQNIIQYDTMNRVFHKILANKLRPSAKSLDRHAFFGGLTNMLLLGLLGAGGGLAVSKLTGNNSTKSLGYGAGLGGALGLGVGALSGMVGGARGRALWNDDPYEAARQRLATVSSHSIGEGDVWKNYLIPGHGAYMTELSKPIIVER